MSLGGRNPNRGPKGVKVEKTEKILSKTEQITEKNKAQESNPKVQATAEQMRIAQMISSSKIDDDPLLQEKINQVIQITGLSQDEAMIALYDCDNDPNRAINMLIEGDGQGEWQESTKKKKSKSPGNIKSLVDGLANNKENRRTDQSRERDFTSDRERSRNRGPPPRMRRGGGSTDKSWKGKENQENEKNLEDSRENSRRKMANGPGSRGVGRGGRRGMGPRTFQNRNDFPRQIDTWSNSQAEHNCGTNSGEGMQVGNWDDGFPTTEDWDNEEWTGSLSDTKVFTPTSSTTIETTMRSPASPLPTNDTIGPSLSTPPSMSQSIDLATLLAKPPVTVSETGLSNSLVSQQQQFLSQFTQQATESLKSAVGVGTSNVSPAGTLGSSYGAQTSSNFDSSFPSAGMTYPSDSFSSSTSSYGSQLKTTSTTGTPPPVTTSIHHVLPPRNKINRPRLPPPSKIPASAVEMPDDSMTALDVQFGGLEFGTEPYEFSSDQASFQAKEKTTPSSKEISQPTIVQTQKIGGSESVPFVGSQTAERKPANSTYSQPPSSSLDLNNKVETPTSTALGFSNKTNSSLYSSHKTSVTSYPSGSTYSQHNYGVDQTQNVAYGSTSTAGYQVQSNNYGGTHSLTQSAYPNQTASAYTQANSSYQQNQVTNSYPSSSVYPSVSQSSSSFPSGNQSNSNYQGANQTSNSFQAAPTYGNSFSVSSSGQYQNSYGVTSSTSTTHSHNSLGNIASSKLNANLSTSKENQFDSVSSSSANLSSVLTGAGSITTSGANIPKTSTKSGSMANMPAGVPAVLGHQYFVGQAGLPFYPGVQQTMYAYEDLHALQQRIPHMAPTSLSGRDNAVLGSMAYSGTEAKFSRTDNSSPIPSTLSQQNASTHQQPFFNAATAAALPPGYPYFAYGGAVLPQYSIYPAVPPATNTHGVTNNTQFQKMPYGTNTYNSYDSLTATNQTQDYKSVYGTSGGANVGMTGGQAQNKMGLGGSSNSGSAGSDLTGSMYGKMQLGKSFEKQGFHTGTPPPFNLAGAQTNTLAAAPSGYPHMFIPALPQHSPLMPHQAHQDSTASSGQRSGSQPGKGTAKQAYNATYWATN